MASEEANYPEEFVQKVQKVQNYPEEFVPVDRWVVPDLQDTYPLMYHTKPLFILL
jgi:hypothetical protein